MATTLAMPNDASAYHNGGDVNYHSHPHHALAGVAPSGRHATVDPTPSMGTRPVTDDCVNLFVNYLPLTVTDNELLQRFAPFGRVLSAKIMRHMDETAPPNPADLSTLRSKGYGFVLMADRDDAQRAIGELNASKWDTKRLVVQIAQRLPADANVPVRQQPQAPAVPGRPAPGAGAGAVRVARGLKPSGGGGGVAPNTVDVSPVDPTCTLARISGVLEAYGAVASAQVLPSGTARVTFVDSHAADEACRWLHTAQVPQIAARSPLSVVRVDAAGAAAAAAAAARDAATTRNRARRTQLAPTDATLVAMAADPVFQRQAPVSARSYPMPPLHQQHPMPAAVHASTGAAPRFNSGSCQHGPYCQCGVDSAAAKPIAMSKRSTRAQLGLKPHPQEQPRAAGHRGKGTSQRHDPYARGTSLVSRQQPQQQMHFAASAGYSDPYATNSFNGACPNGCHYCTGGTTVILQNMPSEEVQCLRRITEVLGPIGYYRNEECWGNGQAVATFPDYHCAAEAVEILRDGDHNVDFYDCAAGLPASQVPRSHF